MQQYKRPEAIKRMNELAGSRKPFLFIIDYKQQCSLIEEISRIDSTRCRYNFNGVKKCGYCNRKLQWADRLELCSNVFDRLPAGF